MPLDIDMLVVPEMSESLNSFFDNDLDAARCQKCLFIVPIYEIHESVKNLPENKKALLQLIKKGLARRFHVKVRFQFLSYVKAFVFRVL